MTVNLKDINFTTEYQQHTLGDDMRLINIEQFGKFAITSRLDERQVFKIVSKSKIRSCASTANHLVCKYAELVSSLDHLCSEHVCCSEQLAPLAMQTIS